MKRRPTLKTDRLILRPFTLEDAPDVHRLAGERAVAHNTLNIPYPYEEEMARDWISTHQEKFEDGELVNFAIVKADENILIGTVGLRIMRRDERAELGYWIGRPFWDQGYCTEAAKAVLEYGFMMLRLRRIHASHFGRNSASGRVMKKIGMTHEGTLRKHIKKWEVFEDSEEYGILKEEFLKDNE